MRVSVISVVGVHAVLAGAASPVDNGFGDGLRNCLLAAVGGNIALVAFQGEPFYQAVAVKAYNLNIPITPAAVTFPKSSDQVAAVVKCAAERGYKVQSKCGGHSYGNYGLGGTDGEIVVDLKNMKQTSMDDATFHATFGGGVLLSDVDKYLHSSNGRAISHGTCPQVGLGGHATIGGLGPTSRQFGMALDHILEVEVVLANSSIIRASETQNRDLLFAIKGAAAGFGIVTEFTVRTEKEETMAVQYSYTFAFGNTSTRANLFKKWQSFISDSRLTRKFASIFTILPGSVVISGTFFGTKAEYDSLGFEDKFPGYANSNVVVFRDWLGLVGSWSEDLILDLGGGVPTSFYSRSLSFNEERLIPNATIDDLFHYVDTNSQGSLLWFVIFDLAGGATNDIPSDATAYVHRDVLFWMQSYATSVGPVSKTTYGFLDGINELLTKPYPGVDFGAYPGYVDPRLTDAQKAYWGSNLARLEKTKSEIDPNDVFHNPQSVQPESGQRS
ncbi:glucooligosaccharide oxidase [Aspergillus sclerotialis]|uniref:Glucooligosaccharide oxidase n=1 Tax=Aspergillus sclerotialis TaxID=2070753 RepID=A0A3A3ABV2_9EURO|nr:glucooligosaccharide oxidase [Aspergillus sclerotialis]